MVNELVGWNNYIIINLRNTRDLNEVGPVEIYITIIIHRAEIRNRNMHEERRMLKWEIWFKQALSALPSFRITSCYVEVYLRLNLGEHDIEETDSKNLYFRSS